MHLEARKLKMFSGGALFTREARHPKVQVCHYEARYHKAQCRGRWIRHVGMRMRQRRVMLGLTQRQVTDRIGITYQQACKYESGANRVSAGPLDWGCSGV